MNQLWHEAAGIWLAGGGGMVPLAVNSLILAWLGLSIRFRLFGREYRRLSATESRRWLDSESARQGPVGALVTRVLAAPSLIDLEAQFDAFRQAVTGPFDRDLRIMQVCVGVSPLLGLLGTVTGMLTTFGALATGSGGEQTMKMVAKGISEALITTETGLIIAIPGLLFVHYLQGQQQRYRGFLAHLETLCAQAVHRGTAAATTTVVQPSGPTPNRSLGGGLPGPEGMQLSPALEARP